MSTDTKTLLATIVTATILACGLVITLHNGVRADLRDMRTDLRDVRTDLTGWLDRMDARLDGFDARLRAVEVAFGKVDQRLATLERAILPTAPPPTD